MQRVAALLLVASCLLAQGMPPPSRIDGWRASHNQKRLKLEFDSLPDTTPIKLPDGSTEPRRAPWPFVLYVVQEESKSNEKLQRNVLEDARFSLAVHAVKLIKIKPAKAIDLSYLASVQGIRDPALVVVDRDFKVVGALTSHTEFTANKVLDLLVKAADAAYEGKLTAYIADYFKLMQDAEKLWEEEQKIEALASKAGTKDPAKAKEIDREVAAREAELEKAMDDLAGREAEIRASLKLIGEKVEALPTSVGSGKSKRKLTPQELEALAAFRDFARDDNPIVRAAAVEDLGAIDSAVMVEAILEAANDLDPRVLEAAGRALGRMKSDESLAAMDAALGSGNAKAKQAALLGFAAVTRSYPPAIPRILPFLRSGDEEARRAAILAVQGQQSAEGAKALVPLLSDSVPALRVIAATALGSLRSRDGVAGLCEALGASDWSLQKAAGEALGKIRAKESIEPLLDRFEKEEGLMVEVLQKALVAVTGQDFSFNAENWRKWWTKFGAGFVVPTDEEVAAAKAKAEKALEGYATPDKRKYHNIETLSRKMLFVIDISGSMRDKIVLPPDATAEQQAEYPDRMKMEIAKKATIDFLATVDGNVYFNIITFAGKVDMWRDNLVSGSQRTTAIKHVAKLKALEPSTGGRKGGGGGEEQKTNTYAALMAAFGQAEAAVPDWKARTKVDTIFLVTDGLPTTGEIVEVPKLIREITEINKSRGIVIHVITFDKIAHQQLTPLATQNGGQCVLRGY